MAIKTCEGPWLPTRLENDYEVERANHARTSDSTDSYGSLRGATGSPSLAEELNVPVQTWLNYEQGVTLPADVFLRFLELPARTHTGS